MPYTTTVRDAIKNRTSGYEDSFAAAMQDADFTQQLIMLGLMLNSQPSTVDDFTVAGNLAVTGTTTFSGAVTGDTAALQGLTVDVDTVLGGAGGGTTTGVIFAEVARTATADGTTTGTIAAGTNHVTVTSDDANKIIILPAPVVGHEIWIHNGATGYELRSSDPATIAINGGTGSNAESAIPANSTCVLRCVTATAWKGFFLDADGDLAKIEAAA